MRLNFLHILLLFIVIGGCSQKSIYESAQESLKYECLKLPESQYNDCVDRASKTYEEYERERKIIIDN